MIPIRGILFDCFHTLIDLRFELLPILELPEGSVRSSAPLLAEVLRDQGHKVEAVAVHRALVESWQSSEKIRRETLREISARVRLSWLLDVLQVQSSDELVEQLLEVHSNSLIAAMVPMPGAMDLLQSLHGRLPVGMVSNFDRTRTVEKALEQFSLRHFFKTVVISEEHGVVKPHPKIFLIAAETLQVSPAEILFIGDQPVADVKGALGVGMQALWFAYKPELARELPDGIKRATHLDQLRSALNSA